LKISIIIPSGEKFNFEADYYEFSQNKYVNEDVVLVFCKNESPNEKGEEQKISRPSKIGVLSSVDLFSEFLKNAIGEEKLKKVRDEAKITFIDESKPFISYSTKKIITESRDIDDNTSMDKVLEELINKEKELAVKYQLKILKEPILKFDESKFHIEEEISIGKEKTEVQ
jgi:hypothetical protein